MDKIDGKFVLLNGQREENLKKEISFERADSNKKVVNIRPIAYKITLSKAQLENMEKNILEVGEDYLEVKYSRYKEKVNKDKKKIDELNKMFEDNDKVVVFDSYKYKK